MQTVYAEKVVIDENDRYITVIQMMDPQGNELETPYKEELGGITYSAGNLPEDLAANMTQVLAAATAMSA